jgi:hypothetical protein
MALVHLASRTLGHMPLPDSTTAAGLHGGVPGGTIASFITACEDVPRNHHRSPHTTGHSPLCSVRARFAAGSSSASAGCVGASSRLLPQQSRYRPTHPRASRACTPLERTCHFSGVRPSIHIRSSSPPCMIFLGRLPPRDNLIDKLNAVLLSPFFNP